MQLTKFLNQGHAEDILLFHRYRYYCLACPVISDKAYDRIEYEVRKTWEVSIADTPGSDNPQDYPVYIREGRRPDPEDRRNRDERIAERWLNAL